MSWFIQTCTSSLGKKYIMAITGLMLGGFLVVHAAGNSSIFWGRAAFISYAEHLHALGILVSLAETGLLSIFLLHVVTGLSLFLQNNQARSSRYAVSTSAGGRTWGSRTMPYTGLAILCFIIVHLLNFHFTDHSRPIADIVGPILGSPVYTLFYGTAMLILTLHISHGFWSLFQTLGLSHPGYDDFIRIMGWVIGGIIVLIFLTIILLLIVSTNYLI
ncbi:MAG: succinate dehydrogenase [Desulfobulbaceae bacterium]|nr:succinate dehydrogenase [Desulfobulbaceae bacterium]